MDEKMQGNAQRALRLAQTLRDVGRVASQVQATIYTRRFYTSHGELEMDAEQRIQILQNALNKMDASIAITFADLTVEELFHAAHQALNFPKESLEQALTDKKHSDGAANLMAASLMRACVRKAQAEALESQL